MFFLSYVLTSYSCILQVDEVSGCQVECENNKLSQISMTVATDLPFEESCNKTLDGGAAENLPVAPQNVASHSEGEKSLKNRGKSILVYTRKGTKGYRKENAMQNIPPKTVWILNHPFWKLCKYGIIVLLFFMGAVQVTQHLTQQM